MSKKHFALLLLAVVISGSSCKQKSSEKESAETVQWHNMLDKDLSQWRIYQSFENVRADAQHPTDINGQPATPIGYDKNLKNVFSTVEEGNDLLLHISGEIYGCVFTKESYRNYHLKLKYKWGDKKYSPRLDRNMDSGILYHSQGEAGVDYWKSWMLSQEFQLLQGGSDEGQTGDYWPIASSQIDIRASLNETNKTYMSDINAPFTTISGACYANKDYEKKDQEWTFVELICFEGKSLHIVNGEVAMVLSNSRFLNQSGEEQPLLEGLIQIQSEAAEVFFKDIFIRQLDQLPDAYKEYFYPASIE